MTKSEDFNIGVPQSSCIGIILGLVVINILLRRLHINEAWFVQVFADDVFVSKQSTGVNRFSDILCPILSVIRHGALEFIYAKLCARSFFLNAGSITTLIEQS